MVNEQPPDPGGQRCTETTIDLDRLLATVASFGDQRDRAALLRRAADAVREHLGCDDAAVLEEPGAAEPFGGPARAALVARAAACEYPIWIPGRDLLHAAHDAPPVETWAVAPLSRHGRARALVAAWRTRRDPRPRELRALGVLARWAAATLDLRDGAAAVEASRAASEEFVSAAAHELRTPLTPIRLTIDRAARALEALDDRQRARGALARVDEHLRRMTHVVDSLLEAARVARGDLVLVRRDVDLAAVVAEVVARHAEVARQSGCAMTVEAGERVVGRWDAQRVREVVAQLLGNAIKFGGGAPVRIALAMDGGTARLLVRDEGGGIAAADHERIFERFERAVSVRNFGGLGVGLWLARELARAHGGDVTVASSPGEGAEFTLRLPLGSAPVTGSSGPGPRHRPAFSAERP